MTFSRFHIITVISIALSASAMGDVGRVEIAQHMMPYTISSSGSYIVTENLTGSAFGNGLTITASDVSLDLNGFTLIGVTNSVHGIYVTQEESNISIRNGILRGWQSAGINATNVVNGIYEDLVLSENLGGGLFVGFNSVVNRCVAYRNGSPPGPDSPSFNAFGHGLWIENSSKVSACLTLNNNHHGLRSHSGSTIEYTVMGENGHDGFHGSHSTVVKGCVATRNSEGIEVDAGSVVTDCASSQNNEDGMRVKKADGDTRFGAGIFEGCTSYANTKDGFDFRESGNRLSGCNSYSNLAHGIRIEHRSYVVANLIGFSESNNGTDQDAISVKGDGNRIEDNHLVLNTWDGIRVDNDDGATNTPVDNIFLRNSATANGHDDIDIDTNNHFTIADPSSGLPSGNAWVNFDY